MRVLLWCVVPALACAQGITPGERVKIAVERTIWPLALFTSSAGSAIQHWRDVPPEWGQGMEAYGRRLGWHVAGNAAGNAMELAASAALREDPRYRPSGERPIGRRIRHIFSGTFRAPVPLLAGAYGSGFLGNLWFPPSANSPADAVVRGTISVGTRLGGNAFLEFWHDLKRRIFQRP